MHLSPTSKLGYLSFKHRQPGGRFLKNPRCGRRRKSILDVGSRFLKSRRRTPRCKTWRKPRCGLGQA